jgi:ketosteroid isomerase-like protein
LYRLNEGGDAMTPEALMRSVAEALDRGDPQVLLEALDEDVVWKTGATQKGFFAFGGTYNGSAGVRQMLVNFSKNFRYTRVNPREVTSSGEIVWGHFYVELEYVNENSIRSGAPRSISTEMAIRWQMRDNKIVEHQAFFDTATLLFAPHPVPSND